MTTLSDLSFRENDLINAAIYHKLETLTPEEKDSYLYDFFRTEYENIILFKEIVDRMISEFDENGFEKMAKDADFTSEETELLIYMDSLETFKRNHNWIIDDIFDQATENLPLDQFEEYYDDYQGYSSTYSNDAVNVFLKHFPIDELTHFDSYYQGMYDSIDEFYEHMNQHKEDDPDCDYDPSDYVFYDDYVFDKHPLKAGPYV